nr:myticofensin A2 [Mytilus coruscus]
MKLAIVLLASLYFITIFDVTDAGFGCPYNQYQCHNHCRSITGRCGGYCGGWAKLTCICYTNGCNEMSTYTP